MLGAVRQQAITSDNFDPDLWCHCGQNLNIINILWYTVNFLENTHERMSENWKSFVIKHQLTNWKTQWLPLNRRHWETYFCERHVYSESFSQKCVWSAISQHWSSQRLNLIMPLFTKVLAYRVIRMSTTRIQFLISYYWIFRWEFTPIPLTKDQ